MVVVQLTNGLSLWRPLSQKGTWKDLQFVPGEVTEADWCVTYDDPPALTRTRVPKERRIIFMTEPPQIKDYYPHFTNQFGIAVSPMPLKGFKGKWIQRHGALNWHLGPTLEQLAAANYSEKQFDLSVVCSAARKFPEHRRRFEFVSKLKEILGERLHWYGRGVRDIDTKAEAIIPYRYSIAIENNYIEHFWTEKIADVYLGCAFPLYIGGPNLERYFDRGTFEYLDPDDPVASAKIIEKTIEAKTYEERLPLIREERSKVLMEYNFLNEVWRVIKEQESGTPLRPLAPVPQVLRERKSGVRSWFLDQPRRLRRSLERLEHRY
jgi:hypothetical protein